jgi:hypothetical protein
MKRIEVSLTTRCEGDKVKIEMILENRLVSYHQLTFHFEADQIPARMMKFRIAKNKLISDCMVSRISTAGGRREDGYEDWQSLKNRLLRDAFLV